MLARSTENLAIDYVDFRYISWILIQGFQIVNILNWKTANQNNDQYKFRRDKQ